MAVARIGVVADTHCPEFLDPLPPRLLEVLAGVDLILHAGDINAQSTLDELARVAPLQAVAGDHDAPLASLPEHRELEIEGRSIVVVHGNRSRWLEEPATFLWTISLGYWWPHRGLPRHLRRRFPNADVVVFGHTHRGSIDRSAKPMLFNPGGVHQWTPATTAARLRQRPGWFEWCWLQVARHMRSYPRPTVGILEVTAAGIEPQIIAL